MIYVTTLLCALILSLFAYRYDMYDREPWYMLVLAVFVGGGQHDMSVFVDVMPEDEGCEAESDSAA